MEEKKKIWEKKWFAFLIVFVVAPLAIFFVISLLVKEPKEVADSSPKKEVVATMANDGEKSDHSEKKTDLKSKRAISSDGVKVSSFVADVKKKPRDPDTSKESNTSKESDTSAGVVPEDTPTVPVEPIREPGKSTGSMTDKQIAAEIDEYVNVFLVNAQREGLAIQQEHTELMAGGALTKENARKVKAHLVPRMVKLSDVFVKKKVKGNELRAIHEVAVVGEKSKYESILKYVRAYETNDGALANEATAEINQLTESYNDYGLRVIELANKYGVTIRQ